MPPVPLEGNQTPVASMPQEGNRGGSISLGLLIDFIIQRTYHELSVLAELLPRKTDMERKIEIYNFSARTRQLFIRLLALVKWANSVTKVEKSAHIMAFLDKQSLLFVDTADILARMARETLVHARLPNFHIPAAVEVLTTGSFNRLPTCIREKIVPPDPITTSEKKSTLQRLNQVIQHRLVTGNLLPQMKSLDIDAGRVTFRVEQEFSVSLTVMGDGPNLPWRLLDLEILVSDRETGDGKSLVHPLQTQYLHRVVQARLLESSNPLSEVYHILHYFCQSLQLEVLYSQTLRLMRDRLDDYIRIDKYIYGQSLTISYWKELTNKDSGSELGYKLSVLVDQHDPAKPLAIQHTPSLINKECEVSEVAIRSNLLSMEYLLVHTIYIRTRNRLTDLKQELQSMFKGMECTLAGSPAILSVPVLQPCLRSEFLLISVDTHTGKLQCHIPQYDAPLIPDLTTALNEDRSKLSILVSEVRFWITQKRCEKTLQHLPATAFEKLPLLYSADHVINSITKHRVFIKFHKHPTVILIVAFNENELAPCEIQCTFYLCAVKPSSIDSNTNDDSIDAKGHNVCLKLESVIEFDTFVVTHGSFTSIDCESEMECSGATDSLDKIGKKRRSGGFNVRPDPSCLPHSKRPKSPAYFIPELAHVVALCDEQIPFVMLAQELTKREIAHQGLQIEANATALVLKLVQLPTPSTNVSTSTAWNALLKRLLSVAIRVQGKGTGKSWLAEFVFYGSPLVSSHPKEQSLRRPIYFHYEMGTVDTIPQMVDTLLNNWAQIVNLYSLVHDLAEYYKMEKSNISNISTIKSYNYSKLVMAYGPNRRSSVTIQWDAAEKAFKLNFDKNQTSTIENAHSLLREQLEVNLNQKKNLAQLMHILNETLQPLTSIHKLPILLQLGIFEKKPNIPVQSFIVMPQCTSLVRISYQNLYCLELCFRGEGFVSLRDGAYSRFDHSNVVDGFTPIQGLSTFLSQYVDKNAMYRRRSQSEDDNPPSPMTVDNENSGSNIGFMSHRGPQSPAAQQREGLRFHPSVTPPSGSNPNTPASPHTGNISQSSHYGNSPGMSLSLASPPTLTPNTPNVLPHPSPNSNLVASPLNQMQAPSPAGLLPTSSPGPGSNVQVGHSPASSYMQTGHVDGSPFPSSQSMASPAASNWAGSPSISRPSPARPGQSPGHMPLHSPQQPMSEHRIPSHVSRVLPQKSWAGAIPTLLSYETLDVLCSYSKHPLGFSGPDMSPLERFLACVFMRRQLQRFIQNNENITDINSNEPGVTHFKVETLQFRVFLNSQNMQSLHIKIQPIPEHQQKWIPDEIQCLEKFFDTRILAAPYKPNTLQAFVNILNLPLNVLKDFIQIMKLDMIPGLAQQHQLKWSVQWCLRVPPSATPVIPGCGQPAILYNKGRILFYLQITRIGLQCREGEDPPLVILPLLYEIRTNGISLYVSERDATPIMVAASNQLKRFNEYAASSAECSIFTAVRGLLMNLALPTDTPQQMNPVGQPMPNPQQMNPVGQPMPNPQQMNPVGQPMPNPQQMNPVGQPMPNPGMMMPGAQGPPPGPYR